MNKDTIIESLFREFNEIRYVALYIDDELVFKQKKKTDDSSSGETDRYEELLVNPTLLKLASQRGNMDCGGLDHLIVGYGNFYQLVKSIPNGHISVFLEKASDLNILPKTILRFLKDQFGESVITYS
ncbi:MAG: hypothetical protein AAGA80_26465 [Cyanobacteria bacterium P01_F01_bin.143]